MSLIMSTRAELLSLSCALRQAFQYTGFDEPTKVMQFPASFLVIRIAIVYRMIEMSVERGWIRISLLQRTAGSSRALRSSSEAM